MCTALKLHYVCMQIGIALGLVLPPDPTHPALHFGVQFAYHLAPTDAGYAVVLYLWLLVSGCGR